MDGNEKGHRLTNKNILTGYFFLAAIEAILGIAVLFSTPSEPKNQWLWGYSLPRIVLFIGFLSTLVILLRMAWYAWRNIAWAERIWRDIFSSHQRTTLLLYSFGLSLILTTSLLLTPLYRFGIWQAYMERLMPLLFWGALLSTQTNILLFYGTGRYGSALAILRLSLRGSHVQKFISLTKKSTFLPSSVVFVFLALTWVWISHTKTGILPNGAFQWEEIGVPLLAGQLWLIIWGTVLLTVSWRFLQKFRLQRKKEEFKFNDNADLLIGIAIWAFAAFLWANTPLPKNFFFPGPYPPNSAIYPFADAASWDMWGQFALVGQGFANGYTFADHSSLSGFLAIMHLLIGQDYKLISALQAALLAVFPAILYGLGKSMHSRRLGLFVAALVTVHELNAFAASTMLDLSHARFLLTEIPVKVGLAAISLWLFLWAKRKPESRIAYALPIGGTLALLIMLRSNTLVMPFAVLAGIILIFGRNWKGWLTSSLLVILSMTIVLSPWMWRSWSLSGSPFFFKGKTQAVFSENFRFTPPATPTPLPATSSNPFPATQNISLQTDNPANYAMLSAPLSGKNEKEVTTIADTITNHFFHNLVTSVLILPTNPFFHDLRHTINEVHPYWGKINGPWQGDLTSLEGLGLSINLVLLSIGIGFSWKKWELAGLVPLGIFIAYDLSLALARTSGGRYIVPIDWVVLLYFALGIMQVIFWGATLFGLNIESGQPVLDNKIFTYKKGVLSLLPFFLFVSAMTVIDQATPQRYPALTKMEIFEKIIQEDLLAQTDLSSQELSAFLEYPDAHAFFGLDLFPRYYPIGLGEHTAERTAYSPETFPRIGFTFIGPFGAGQAVLPLSKSPTYFPHAEDVIVLGCIRKPSPSAINISLDAILVIVLGEEQTAVYTRDPAAPLQCPLPDPVCDGNRNCK